MPRTVSTWAKSYVRNVAEHQFTSSVRIHKVGTPVLDTVTGIYTSVEGADVYEGPARIWSVDGSGVLSLGEGDYAMQATYCSIPWDAEPVPDVDDQVEVIASDDTELIGQRFRVMSVDGGGLTRATRRLSLAGLTENRSWQP
jgi:hypothetical protein